MECVSSESDVYRQTDKFDLNKPVKVTCIFEDSDSDGNIAENENPESIPSPQCSALKDLLTTPSTDNNCNENNVCSESMINTLNIEHKRLSTHGNCIRNVQNTNTFQSMRNLQSSSKENNINNENNKASNYSDREANKREHFQYMLDKISETLITIAKCYHYYSNKYKRDRSVREEYINRKNEYFLQIYDLSLSLLVPRENNHIFIRNFIHRTIEIAHRKQWHHHVDVNSLEELINGLIFWTKQKKKYLESSNNVVTPIAMPVQQVPASNGILNINTRQPMNGMAPISTTPFSNRNVNSINPPPYYSFHDVSSPTVPQGSRSTRVETINKIAPIAIPAQSIPPVHAPQRTLTYYGGFNVQQQLNGGAPVPSIPFSNSRFDIQQQNSGQSKPQIAQSNTGFNVQHPNNGAHSVSAMPTSNNRFYLEPHMNGAPSLPPIPTSNSGFNVRHMNQENFVSGVPTSNTYHSRQLMNRVPSTSPMTTSYYSGFNVNYQKIGAPYYKSPVPTSNSGYYVENGINGTHSLSAVPTSNSGSPILPVATSNTGFSAHQRINGPPALSPIVTSNSLSNGANNIQQQQNNLSPVLSPTSKPKNASYGRNNVNQCMNSPPAVSPTSKTKSASNITNKSIKLMSSSPTTKTNSASKGANDAQKQMNGDPMSGPQPVTNLQLSASYNININENTFTDDPNNTIRLYSTGPPGNEISISVDRAVVNTVILEKVREILETPSTKRPITNDDTEQPKKICKKTSQEIIETNHIQTPRIIDNGENMNKTNQLQTSLETSQNNCEIPFRARSVSRDSGFGSPALSTMLSDNNTVYPNSAVLQGLPEISYVTSLHPNAEYNDMSLCKICGSLTKKKCIRCYKEYYCGSTCQEIDWPLHMHKCIPN